MDSGPRVWIVETDGQVVEIKAQGEQGAISVITELIKLGQDLVLRGLHIEGLGPGTSSLKELRQLARALALQKGAKRVIIEGGIRTTGAKPGHKPRQIIISVEGGA